jgi:hypothetical protein
LVKRKGMFYGMVKESGEYEALLNIARQKE